jgi:hypothetical protein
VAEAEVRVLKVDLDGRYLVVLESASHLSVDGAIRIKEQMTASVREWWEGGEKFGFLVVDGALKVKLERVGPEGK